MTHRHFTTRLAIAMVFGLMPLSASAITVVMDYSRDTNGFFGASNPQGATAGAQAKAALDAAASYFTTVLNDTFSAIVKPADFHSSVFDGQVIWNWEANFTNPATGGTETLNNPTVAANEYRIFAGARNLSGSTAGIGGPGGYGWSSDPSGGFTSQEIDQIDAITETFSNQVEDREEVSGFASWGGSITFDRDASTTWHFNHTTAPSGGTVTDFYSVAVHELTHAFGFATADEYQAFVSGLNFFGPNAMAAYGGVVPLTANGHWAEGTMSTVYGTATTQEAAMDPTVLNGTRKFFATLDGAALTDIGWELVAPPVVATGDYNANGKVDAADYVVWRNTNGQSVPNGTGADGSGNGSVGPEDYSFWRSKFGQSIGSGASLEGGAVPEPASFAAFCIGGICLSMMIASRSRGKPQLGP